MQKGKGKGKRTRDDDIPPKPDPEDQGQVNCLLELQEHMLCQTHSSEGITTYCWNEPATKKTPGGHKEYNHAEMTLWAKHMVSHNHSKKINELTAL